MVNRSSDVLSQNILDSFQRLENDVQALNRNLAQLANTTGVNLNQTANYASAAASDDRDYIPMSTLSSLP